MTMTNLMDEVFIALVECEAVLSQLQNHMPLEGQAQAIMAQGYTGSAIVKARQAIAHQRQLGDEKRSAQPCGRHP